MASTIKLKNGSGAPTSGQLVQGEPALDLTNKRLYTENASGTVIEVGTNPSSLTIGGTALTATAAELNTLDGITATTAELNTLDGITATVTELNYTDGVTSNIQTQLNTKAPIASPTFTGTVTAPAVNINGTVTADGLSVDGTTTLSDANVRLYLMETDTTDVNTLIRQSSSALRIQTVDDAKTEATVQNRLVLDHTTGDLSLFEDTGTTAKFFWDASAESLGIGRDDPSSSYAVDATAGYRSSAAIPNFTLVETDASNQTWQINSTAAKLSFRDVSRAADRIVIDTVGNVGIGTSSPATGIEVGTTNYTYAGTNYDIYGLFGSSATGGIRLGNDSVTGAGVIGNAGENPITFVTYNGSAWGERMRIDSAGNVGIGTTSPSVAAHAVGKVRAQKSGQSAAYIQLSAEELTSNYAADIFLNDTGLTFKHNSNGRGFVFDQNGTERMRIDSSGNVGIGVTPATDWNTAYDALQIGQGAAIMSASGTEELFLNMNAKWASDSSWEYIATGTAASIRMDQTAPFTFRYAASGSSDADITWSEAMRIDSSGNLLVGKTAGSVSTAGHDLYADGLAYHVRNGGICSVLNRLTSDGDIAVFRKDGTTVGSIGSRSGVASTFILDPRASGTGISAAGVQLWPTNESGTVSNGANDLGGSSARWKDLYLSGGLRADTLTFSSLAGTERARIDSSGNLLVGCTAKPSASVVGTMISDDLDTEGNKTATSLTTSATHFVFLNPNGAVGSIATSASATVYNTLSDQRLKENIVDAPSASDDIDAIQVRSFDWKADGSHQKYGMVAQELMTVAPEAVSGDPDSDEIMGVDYSKLVPMMMKEIQSLRARVAQLEGVN